MGNLYGTTLNGGQGGPLNGDCGTVFAISSGTETVLYPFTGMNDGCYPMAGLIMDGFGNLYGTTQQGGEGYGTVFETDTLGNLTTLWDFGGGTDGAYPLSSLIMDQYGFLYGTTQQGGGYGCGGNGCGTVYSINSAGPPETQLYAFTGGPTDGANPYGALVMDQNNNLYGTTYGGGTGENGTVFELEGTTSPILLHSFGGSPDGINPVGGLVLDKDGHLYGTTTAGGTSHRGTVFYVVP
jgi:uncharacterized repeat protein (TIGR03803 family)